jgi:probable phosphoglycerate mutase
MKSQPAKNLLVCTHGRTMRALVTLMKNKELAQMEDTKHANTGCYIVRLQNNHFIFDVENSISHLVNLSNS